MNADRVRLLLGETNTALSAIKLQLNRAEHIQSQSYFSSIPVDVTDALQDTLSEALERVRETDRRLREQLDPLVAVVVAPSVDISGEVPSGMGEDDGIGLLHDESPSVDGNPEGSAAAGPFPPIGSAARAHST